MRKPYICSSANFYRQAVKIQTELEALKYKILIPETAQRMKDSDDFDVSHYKTWFGDANDYHKKTVLIRKHFLEVEKGDAMLVLNYEKNDIANYIGGNVLMEMAIAFYLSKPIFILNDIPEVSSYLEEIIALDPIVLHGSLQLLTSELKKLSI